MSNNKIVDNVLHTYIKKDRTSVYLERMLEAVHNLFSAIESSEISAEDFSDLFFIMGQTSPEETRRLNDVLNNLSSTTEYAKSLLFVLEKVVIQNLPETREITEQYKTSKNPNVDNDTSPDEGFDNEQT